MAQGRSSIFAQASTVRPLGIFPSFASVCQVDRVEVIVVGVLKYTLVSDLYRLAERPLGNKFPQFSSG